jgi:hypothetical protein
MAWVSVNVIPKIAPVLAVLAAVAAGCGETVMTSNLPISDDFSADTCHWATDDTDVAATGCSDQQYRVLVRKPSEQPHHVVPRRFDSVNAVRVDADVWVARFPDPGADGFVLFGLGCWSSPHGERSQGYVFDLAQDGSAGILRHDETLPPSRKRPFFLTQLAAAPKVAGFNPSVPTHVTASCARSGGATRLRMQIGTRVLEAVDHHPSSPFQAAGFDVLTPVPGSEVRFDDFAVKNAGS